MDLKRGYQEGIALNEAEFILEDKFLILESPKRSKKQINRGQSNLTSSKLKKREYRCSYCAILFSSKSVMLNHMTVCTLKANKCEKEEKSLLSQSRGFFDVDTFLLDLLRSALPSDLSKTAYVQFMEKLIQKLPESPCK